VDGESDGGMVVVAGGGREVGLGVLPGGWGGRWERPRRWRGVGSFLACGEAWDAWLWIACCWVGLMIEGGCGRHGSLWVGGWL